MKKRALILSIITLFLVCVTAFAVSAANEKNLTVSVNYGEDISVYVNGIYSSEAPCTLKVAKGAEVRLVNNSTAGDFLYFSDSTGATFGNEGEYTFTMVSDIALSAWYKNSKNGSVCLTYMNTNSTNQILSSTGYNVAMIGEALSSHLISSANKFGYEFVSWSMTVDEIVSLAESGEKNITVTPVFKKTDRLYTVNVEGGTIKETGTTYSESSLNDVLTLVADDNPAGKKFAYWTNEDGAIIETKSTVTVAVPGNMTYKAVFVDKNATVELLPTVSVSAEYNPSIGRIDSFIQRYCPAEYTIVTYGLIYAKEESLSEDAMTLDTLGTTVKATSQGTPDKNNGVLVNHISVEALVSLRAYITYKNADGELVTSYSDAIVVNKPSDTPCVGGDHDYSNTSRAGDIMYYYCSNCTEVKTEYLYTIVYSSGIDGNKESGQKLSDGLFEALKYKPMLRDGDANIETPYIIDIANISTENLNIYGWTVSGTRIDITDSAFSGDTDVYDEFINAVNTAGGIAGVTTQSFTATPVASNTQGSVYNSTANTQNVIDSIYNTMKDGVLNTGNTDLSKIVGTIYYVSNLGNDSASGMSPDDAWATFANLNSVNLRAGDAVLFERGGVFRGYMNAVSGVTYGSYGDENLQKPIWIGSKQNYAGKWTEVEDNIWKLNVTGIKNPGMIVFGADMFNNESNELVGTRIFDLETSGYAELDKNYEFYHGTPTLTYDEFDMDSLSYDLYVYYSGDLNRDFSSIEIGEDRTMLNVKTTNGVVVDNICFKYNGGHCINGGGDEGTRNVTVTNCVFGWAGGSAHIKAGSSKSITRYGNAIQIYGSVDGFYIENNYIYEMFDTAITVQCGSTSSAAKDLYFANINVLNNVMEKCFWGMEYWGYSSTEYVRAENINIIGNYIGKTGACWGLMGHNNIKLSTALVIDSIGASGENPMVVADKTVKVIDNIFDRSYMVGYARTDIDSGGGVKGYITRLFQTKGDNAQRLYEFSGNVFVQYNDQLMAKIEGEEHETSQLDYAGLFDANTEEALLMFAAYDYMTDSVACVVTRPSDLNITD